MSTFTEISPNEPDVIPDYVDVPAPRGDVFPRRENAPKLEEAAPARDLGRNAPPDAPVPESPPEGNDGGATVEMEEAPAHRDGECVPNVPDIRPDVVDDGVPAATEVPASARLEAVSASVPPAPWLRWHLAATVLAVGVFGVLVFSQAVSALALAASLPVWAQYALLVPLGVCCLAVLGVCAGLARSWLRLRAMRQVDLAALEELRTRAKTRADGVERFQEARSELETYLRRYPLSMEGHAALVTAGIPPAEIEVLAKGREYLLDRGTDSRSWLDAFRREFQEHVDAAAGRRINAWSLKAAGCVIASPLPLLDAILVLGICLRMIKDLCLIYNVRSGRTGTLVLFNKAVFAAFIAGVAERATEAAGDAAMDEVAGSLGEGVIDSFGARVAGAVAPKLGEGAINALFVRRLGKATVRMLQPLRTDR